MRRAVLLLCLSLVTSGVEARAYLDEKQARAKDVQILMGDPYGTTTEEVLKTIVGTELRKDGKTEACGDVKKPVWQFHVHVEAPVNNPQSPIDGFLVLDAVRGKLVCANLPMLD
ncbi:MAG: hypothetical protein ACM3MH_09795 [Actinomycetota bacterium]